MKINPIGHLVKTNPIKPNFRKAQMNVNSLITKDYRKKDDFAVQKNKPNSNPISKQLQGPNDRSRLRLNCCLLLKAL